MRQTRKSGSMSGEGKRGVAERPKSPRPSSTLPLILFLTFAPVVPLRSTRPTVRAPRDPWSSVAPRRSRRACLRSSVDFRTCRDRLPQEQSVRCGGAEVAFNACSVDAAYLPGALDCRPLFRPLTREVAGSSQFFARPFWLRNGRQRERPQAAFLSLRMMMKSSEGGGGNA
jgi:hypothetical protein